MSDLHPTTDRAGKVLADALATRAERLDASVEQRLASARHAALQMAAEVRSAQQAPELALAGGTATQRPRGRVWSWAAPATLVVLGLLGLQYSQWLQQTLGLADRDAAVLKDDLPPDAYRDPAFREYLEEKAEDDTQPPADEDEAQR